jgi:hypothetical protein
VQLVREKLENPKKTVSYRINWPDREPFVWSREQLNGQEWARKLIRRRIWKVVRNFEMNIISKLNELVLIDHLLGKRGCTRTLPLVTEPGECWYSFLALLHVSGRCCVFTFGKCEFQSS